MKISYAITVCNELVEIKKLISLLLDKKREQDEIVVIYDQNNGDKRVEEYLKTVDVNWAYFPFDGDFAMMKNAMNYLCKGDFIFNIDADEIPSDYLLAILPELIQMNDQVDIIWVSRINTVEGITLDHLDKWGWKMDRFGWINYPDQQNRIYRNTPEVKWEGKVHERLVGSKRFAMLPSEEEYSIYHPKTIAKQEQQNNYYKSI